jgi:hypothetical protein
MSKPHESSFSPRDIEARQASGGRIEDLQRGEILNHRRATSEIIEKFLALALT